jgi:hypothetical protein
VRAITSPLMELPNIILKKKEKKKEYIYMLDLNELNNYHVLDKKRLKNNNTIYMVFLFLRTS